VRLIIGVDAGASHSEALVATESLDPLGRATGAPGAVRPGAEAKAARAIADTVHEALRQVSVETSVASVVVGAAGAGAEQPRAALRQALERALGVRAVIAVTTDAAIALEAAFPNAAGIVLSAGTGSIAFARDPAGCEARVGGHGWRAGDEGSAYWIAREALAAAVRGADGRGPTTGLGTRLATAARQADLERLVTWSVAAEPREVAALAPAVDEAARSGDGAAIDVVQGAARELAAHVAALLPPFRDEPTVPLAVAGGILRVGTMVRDALELVLAKEYPQVRVAQDEIDPPLGAVRLGRRS
jgi:N-acetylmuramic acid 6-phosphate etherase